MSIIQPFSDTFQVLLHQPWTVTIIHSLQQPIDAFADPGKRIFIPFLMSSLLFAVWVIYRQSQISNVFPQAQYKAYFTHRSHLTDITLWLFNGFVKLAILAPLFISQLGASILVHKALYVGLGDSPNLSIPFALLLTLFTLAYFIFDDFSRFALHVSLHRVRCLWHLHKVHHSAEVLSPLTVFRLHPLEMVLYTLRQLIVIGVVAGIFSWLFAGKITGWMILGVDAAGFLFNLMAANLRHSHIWLSFGRGERWFISPAQHQIHHSALAEHKDKNFGSCLAIWDKLFHSLIYSHTVKTSPSQLQQLPFGLQQQTPVKGKEEQHRHELKAAASHIH